MRVIETDVVVVGAGTAGLNARRAVAEAGKAWVMVERGPYGTMCARVGCMPSKLLIAAAERVYAIEQAGLFGVSVETGALFIDGPAVLERVRRERDRFVGFVLDANERLPKEQNLLGPARFVGPSSVMVGEDTRVDARAVVLATGSTPTIPPALAHLGDRLETNDTLFERRDLPGKIAVVGSGVVGLELGQALHRLGVETLLLSRRGRFSGLRDADVNRVAAEILGAELDVRLGEVSRAERTESGVLLRWHEADGEHHREVDCVLAATGRHTDLSALDVSRAGLELDERGVPRFDPLTLRCRDAPIFRAGDITGQHLTLHEAVDDGRIAGANAARYPDVQPGRRRTPLAVTFCDPNIAVVGERWHEGLAVGAVDFGRQGRARIAGKNRGLVHLYGRREDRRLVGAEMCGPGVEHLAHLVAWAIQCELTVEGALAMPFYHPVLEEGLRTALEKLRRAL
jgi:dihydrolipoamide dehydrogenase